jgi:outer membrane protein assembly factor BamA
MQQTYAGADITFRPSRWLFVKASSIVEDYTLRDPTGGQHSVEDVHTPATAPGVGVDPTFVHASASVGYDSRPAAGYARRGGLYQLTHHRYIDRDGTYSFNRLDAEIVQHVPILRETWVVSLHGLLQSTTNDEDQVPYFLMPSLGSGRTLRGYNSWRFRDRHAVLTSGEFRWIANRLALDMALFYDVGMVASRLDQIARRSFVSNMGIGVRFHSPVATPIRMELAWGQEGTKIVFSSKAAF